MPENSNKNLNNSSNNRSIFKNKYFIAVLCVLFVLGVGVFYYRKINISTNIAEYLDKRDRALVLKVLKNNWFWMVSDESTNFTGENFIDNRFNLKRPETIKVYLEDNKPVGFIGYYMKSLYVGWIHLLGIDEDYRSKGYAKKLMQDAIQDLESKGAIKVRVFTRVINTKVRNLYEKMGFKTINTDGKYITLEKSLK